MAYVLTVLFATYLASFFMMDRIPEDLQWMLWDYRMLILTLLTSLLFYLSISFKKRKLKTSALLLIALNIWIFLDYTLVSFGKGLTYLEVLEWSLGASFLTFIILLGFTSLYKMCNCEGVKFNATGSFIVYTTPKSFLGLCGSIFESPMGLTFVVVKGKEYRFSRGKIVCRKHKRSDKYTYKLVRDITKSETDQLRGLAWSLFENSKIYKQSMKLL